jgi:uncharacterized protein HemX
VRHGLRWLALAGALVAAPLWARTQHSATIHVSKVAHKDADAVAQQRAEVQRLQHSVAAQESGSQAAARRLRQQDSEIAELQRQLQAAQQAGPVAGKGH